MTAQQYEIQIEGYLGDSWSEWFEGLTIDHTADAGGEYVRTMLSETMDQATLHGVLIKICSLGLPLISVCRTDPTSRADRDNGEGQAGANCCGANQYRRGGP